MRNTSYNTCLLQQQHLSKATTNVHQNNGHQSALTSQAVNRHLVPCASGNSSAKPSLLVLMRRGPHMHAFIVALLNKPPCTSSTRKSLQSDILPHLPKTTWQLRAQSSWQGCCCQTSYMEHVYTYITPLTPKATSPPPHCASGLPGNHQPQNLVSPCTS